MKIMDFLNEKAMNVELKSKDKTGVIEELAGLLVETRIIRDKDKLIKVIMDREKLGSTGIGHGVAIPHGKTDGVSKLIGAFGVSKDGVDFDALDGEKVHLFFLLVAPTDSAGPHLKALARISRLLRDNSFREKLFGVATNGEALKIIKEEDELK